jgi:hypothetical protein
MENTQKRWVTHTLNIFILLAAVVLGHIVSSAIFKRGSIPYFAFFLSWPVIAEIILTLTCKRNGNFLTLRLASFLLVEIASIVITLKLIE